MNRYSRRPLWAVVGALICIFLIGALLVSAQSTPPSIPIGENQSSSLASASSTMQFGVAVTTPQNINVQILATSAGFAPAFRVIDPNNAVIFDDANAEAQNIIQDQVTLASTGTYIVEVRSANSSTGQFTISIQPGAPLDVPIPLPMQQLITATVNPQNTRKVFSFTALSTDALFVEAASTLPTSGPVIRLVNADASDPTGNTFGLANAALTLGRFRMPIGTTHYLLEVTHSGSTFPETVTICLWPEHGASCFGNGSGSNGGSANPTAVPPQSDCGCQAVATTSRLNINIHAYPPPLLPPMHIDQIIGHLPPNTPVQVLGELSDHSWIKINYNGLIGWVLANALTLNDFCDNIPLITVTPEPTPGRGHLPTLPPRDTSTPQLPPPPLPSSTPVGPCTALVACPPTPTPRFHVGLPPTLVVIPRPTPTPTHVVPK